MPEELIVVCAVFAPAFLAAAGWAIRFWVRAQRHHKAQRLAEAVREEQRHPGDDIRGVVAVEDPSGDEKQRFDPARVARAYAAADETLARWKEADEALDRDEKTDDLTAVMDAVREGPCCDMHNQHCEPLGDLCCHLCSEVKHPFHSGNSRCVLTRPALVDGRWVDILDAPDERVTEEIPLGVDEDVNRPYIPVRHGRRELHRACIEAYADRRRDGVCAECSPVMYGMAAR